MLNTSLIKDMSRCIDYLNVMELGLCVKWFIINPNVT